MSGLGEMGNLLKQAQEMQRQMDRVRGELHSKVIEGTAGGGVVRISLSADRQEVKDVSISQDILAQNDPTLMNDLVRAALQDALRRCIETEKEDLGKVTGGMQLPGMF
ncbi:MAG: DNA-binding YbaB/EbfC family protein [Planctomycetota bacterium]|jgi:DNA-binding YbaB/EbfC family protein